MGKTPDRSSPAGTARASIALYKDGPYLVRGEFEIVGQDGRRIDAGRRTVALCRCGKSRMRPFCDGTHRSANFCAPGVAEGDPLPARPLPAQPGPVARGHLPGGDGDPETHADLGGQA